MSAQSPSKEPLPDSAEYGQVAEEAAAVGRAVTKAKKEPPPEASDAIRTRSWIILSFWAIVIFFGLPIWWKTTTIYRAKLPLDEMMEWADGKACRPAFPLQILVDAPSLQDAEAEHLVRTTQHALDDLNDFSAHHLRLQLAPSRNRLNSTARWKDQPVTSLYTSERQAKDAALTIRLVMGDSPSTPSAALEPYAATLEVLYASTQLSPTSSSTSPLASFLANELRSIFAEEQAMIAHLLSESPGNVSPSGSGLPGAAPQQASGAPSPAANGRESRSSLMQSLPPDLAANLARQTTRSVKYAPTYHLTISLFTPSSTPSSWDIEAAVASYISPLLSSLSSISNFTIDTQVQLYAYFSPSMQAPVFNEALSAWTLRQEDLSSFINAAEWPLSPSIGAAPTLNFILYVPTPGGAPLVVKENAGNSWLIPQWGGIAILNPNSEAPSETPHLSKEALRPALLTFSNQLLSLLGVPQAPNSLSLKLLTLTRVRAASLLLSASSTLGSLARLTKALPSISIPATVATSVDRTIEHLLQSCTDLREGRFQGALESARVAEAEAERGFFEKSMVGQVYFPDEHKVAVYLPLLGPIGVPLLMGALKELQKATRAWKQRRASRQAS